jgi:N-acetylglutamate synthase-like GNAT family acetyltransferase
MADFTLRAATQDDFPAIRDLIHRVRINPMSLDWRRFLVAVDSSGSLLGCGQLKPHGKDVIELASIAVEPAYQGRGIATAIIEALLTRAPRPVYLTCRGRLGPFYERWGFRRLAPGQMPVYFQRLARLAIAIGRLMRDDESMLVMELK